MYYFKKLHPSFQFHLFQKDKDGVILISSDESEEDVMPSESPSPEKLDEDERKQHNSSGATTTTTILYLPMRHLGAQALVKMCA